MKPEIIPYQPEVDLVLDDSVGERRPHLPVYQETHEVNGVQFWKTEDIPLSRRNFIYRPCLPNPLFTELGYCTTEYPFDTSGVNIQDRSYGMSVLRGENSVVSVRAKDGWRTARSDVCIKEGDVYWEVEVLNVGNGSGSSSGSGTGSGSSSNVDVDVDVDKGSVQQRRQFLNSSAHVRVGISRREASLEGPVGFDSYGYGLRDFSLESIHDGQLEQVLARAPLKNGDRLGFLVSLPSVEAGSASAGVHREADRSACVARPGARSAGGVGVARAQEAEACRCDEHGLPAGAAGGHRPRQRGAGPHTHPVQEPAILRGHGLREDHEARVLLLGQARAGGVLPPGGLLRGCVSERGVPGQGVRGGETLPAAVQRAAIQREVLLRVLEARPGGRRGPGGGAHRRQAPEGAHPAEQVREQQQAGLLPDDQLLQGRCRETSHHPQRAAPPARSHRRSRPARRCARRPLQTPDRRRSGLGHSRRDRRRGESEVEVKHESKK
ncbi:Hypothetical protein J6897_00801 [Nakaseomyces glabratus]